MPARPGRKCSSPPASRSGRSRSSPDARSRFGASDARTVSCLYELQRAAAEQGEFSRDTAGARRARLVGMALGVIFDVDGRFSTERAPVSPGFEALADTGMPGREGCGPDRHGGEKVYPSDGLAEAAPRGGASQAGARSPHPIPAVASPFPRCASDRAYGGGRRAIAVAISVGRRSRGAPRQGGTRHLVTTRRVERRAERSKPDPDIVQRRSSPRPATLVGRMVGDTPYDLRPRRARASARYRLRSGGCWTDAACGAAAITTIRRIAREPRRTPIES